MTSVEVTTGSRLHFGLICAPPTSAWHYGGIGLMIDAPAWKLRISLSSSASDVFETSPSVRERIQKLLPSFRTLHALPAVKVESLSETPFHAGLGSGTQLTLAAGTAFLLLAGHPRPASIAGLASELGRSRRSAIGTAGFDRGGDGSRSEGSKSAIRRHGRHNGAAGAGW